MTRDMKDELLFAILFFGFLLLSAPLVGGACNVELPSPNAGADPCDKGDRMLPLRDVSAPPSLLASAEALPSVGCSCIIASIPDLPLVVEFNLYSGGAEGFELSESSEIFVPADAG